MSKVVQEFKEFVLRGNVVELAVAVIIGAAFTGVVNSVVDDVVSPIIGLVGGADFSDLDITLRSETAMDPAVTLGYGAVITAAINFLLVAGAVFFILVKPLNSVMAGMKHDVEDEPSAPETPADVALLTEIRDLLKVQQTGPGA